MTSPMPKPNLWEEVGRLAPGTLLRLGLSNRRLTDLAPLAPLSAAGLQLGPLSLAASRQATGSPPGSLNAAAPGGIAASPSLALLKANGWDPWRGASIPNPSGLPGLPAWWAALGTSADAPAPAQEARSSPPVAPSAAAPGPSLGEWLAAGRSPGAARVKPAGLPSDQAKPRSSAALTMTLDPVAVQRTVLALTQAEVVEPHPLVSMVSKAKLGTEGAKYVCDVFSLHSPSMAHSLAGPVAGLAFAASSADFVLTLLSRKAHIGRLALKGAIAMSDLAEMVERFGGIPNTGSGIRSAGLLLRGVDKVFAIRAA